MEKGVVLSDDGVVKSENTYKTAEGEVISKEEFQERNKPRWKRDQEERKSTKSTLTVYPSGKQVRRDYDREGRLTRKTERRQGVRVEDTRTGETEVLYTSQGLPAGPRKRETLDAQVTYDTTSDQRFFPARDKQGRNVDDAYVDVQTRQTISKREMERRRKAEGSTIRTRTEADFGRRDFQTSTPLRRRRDQVQQYADKQKAIVTDRWERGRRGLSDPDLGRTGDTIGRFFAATGAQAAATTISTVDVAATVPSIIAADFRASDKTVTGYVASRASSAAKTAKIAAVGTAAYTVTNPLGAARTVGASATSAAGRLKSDPIGAYGDVLAVTAMSAGAGKVIGAGKKALFPVQRAKNVYVKLPKGMTTQRDLLTERLTSKQVVSLSQRRGPISRSTVRLRQEVPDTALSRFSRFADATAAPDFGVAQTSPTRVITRTVPTSSIPRSTQRLQITGRLTDQGVVQPREFFVNRLIRSGKTGQVAIPSSRTGVRTGVIGRSSITQFPGSRFSAASPRTKVLTPFVSSRGATQNIEDVGASSQPINLTRTPSRTSDIVDAQIRTRGQVTTEARTVSSPDTYSTSVSSSTTATDSPTISAPNIKNPFSPRSPTFNIGRFGPSSPKAPIRPDFRFGSKKSKIPDFLKGGTRKAAKARKTGREFEGVFQFKGLSLDLGKRRLI